VHYLPQERAIYINKTQCPAPVPEVIRNFYIGGYQVIDQCLKSRKARALSVDELICIRAIADKTHPPLTV
jgi:hypothetical protein